MPELHAVDIVIIIVYLAGITALGSWTARRIRNSRDFFMPRRFGKAMMLTHAFGTGTASDQAVVVAGATFTSGLSGIWWQWLWLPVTPFYWLIAPLMRRFRAVTTADVLTLRYNRSVALLYAVVGAAGLSVKIGLLLKGSSVLIDACTGGVVDPGITIGTITVLLLVYGTAWGLGGAVLTDFIQGILTVLFSFMLLPLVLHDAGGLQETWNTIGDPEKLSLVVPGEIGVFFVVMYALQALVGIIAQPFIMSVTTAGRTETDNRVGFMFGNILKRICTLAWSLTAMGALAWYIKTGADLQGIDPDHVYGNMAHHFLPRVFPGLLGIFMASLLASVMSSCDSYMISSAALFTENIYKPLVQRRAAGHYVTVGRISGVAVVAGGVLVAWNVPDVVTALKIWFKIAPMIGIAFWMGILWRRSTAAGAWAATATGFGAWLVAKQAFFIDCVNRLPFADALRLTWRESGAETEIYEPWVIVFYTASAAFAGIVASLLTKPPAKENLERFYALTRTPVQPGEKVGAPCTLPEGRKPGKRRMLCTAFGLEIPIPSRVSVAGFIAGCVSVAALVGGFLWLIP